MTAVRDVTFWPSVDAMPDAARALLDAAEATRIDDGVDWYRLFEREVAPAAGEQRAFVGVRRGARWTLVAPLRRVPSQGWRAPVGAEALTNFFTACHGPAAVDPSAPDVDDLRALVRACRAAPWRVRRFDWRPLDADGPWVGALTAALQAEGCVVRVEPASVNWVLPVGDGVDAESLWAQRPGALRSTARRMGKRFAAAGGTLEILEGDAAATRGLDAYQRVYAASWKVPESQAGFMPGLIRLAAARGWARMGLAWLDGRPVAAHFWLVHARRAGIFKLAYDEAAKAWSPGTLVGERLFRHVVDVDRVAEIDYLTGDDAYKALWMSVRRERLAVRAWPRWHPVAWSWRWRGLHVPAGAASHRPGGASPRAGAAPAPHAQDPR